MTLGWIEAQKGNIVYLSYVIDGTRSGNAGERGIVYGGECYALRVQSDWRGDPTIRLHRIREEAMRDISPIPLHEQGALERVLAQHLKSCQGSLDGSRIESTVSIPLVVEMKQP